LQAVAFHKTTNLARENAMKAIVQDRYGTADVLKLEDIDKPKAASGDVLLRVHAASAHIGDWHFMSGAPI
jgi:NADPH:quinone reductase-like Zn-dependent oxidoreductase